MANSNPWRDEALQDLYRQDNPTCELIRHMEGDSWWKLMRDNHWTVRQWEDAGADLHHIWSDGQRYDVWENFVCVCRPVHKWIHDHQSMGRVVAVHHKLSKGEFDVDRMRDVMDRCPIGAIEVSKNQGKITEGWALDLYDDLMEMVSNLELGEW